MPTEAQGSEAWAVYCTTIFFAELNDVQAGDRVQIINIQGREALTGFGILAETTQTMSRIFREFDKVYLIAGLTLAMSATKEQPLISGIEIVRIP